MRNSRPVRLLVIAAVTVAWLGVVRPSWACGCGALVPSSASGVDVADETSIVRYDGTREDIVMRLSVRSRTHDAAWLMPTPARARVTLGEREWFEQLDRLTEPAVVRRKRWLPRLGGRHSAGALPTAPGSGVGVLGRRRLGPFEVTTLSAADPRALAAWLTSHGYHLPGRLADALRPYVSARWTYTAVKLASEAGPLSGELDPLRVSFPAREPVYPIRLSRLARSPQSVHLYVLAPHRVEPGGLGLLTTYAGRVTPGQVASPALRGLLGGGGAFMTEMVRHGIAPSEFTGDLRLGYTRDTPYRQVEYEDGGVVMFLGMPAFVWLLAVPVLAAGLLTVILGRRSVRARRGRAAGSP